MPASTFLPRPLGRTGLTVSALGLGAGSLGEAGMSDADAERLLHGALDLGIRLIDTAPSYGASEERIGRHLATRRADFVLSTKCGYGVPGTEDWTPASVRQGVDAALRRLRTDHLDIVHFHSCPLESLQRPGLVEALEEAVAAGKVRAVGYSGEDEPLRWAVESGRFAVVQRSVNLCDQGIFEDAVSNNEVGVLAKRPLANAAWSFSQRPDREDVAEYWSRLQAMGFSPSGISPSEVAIRFAAFAPGVSSCLVGTRQLDRLRELQGFLERGPLPAPLQEAARNAYISHGRTWRGLI